MNNLSTFLTQARQACEKADSDELGAISQSVFSPSRINRIEGDGGEMKTIECQANHDKNGGCRVCGGYGIILAQRQCGCGRTGWFRPGAFTTYEGKHYRSFDGLDWVAHPKTRDNCIHCEQSK